MNVPVKQARDALCQALFETREYWLIGDGFVLDYRKLAETTIAALRSLPVEDRMAAMAMRPWTTVTQGVYCEKAADDIETVIEAGVNADG